MLDFIRSFPLFRKLDMIMQQEITRHCKVFHTFHFSCDRCQIFETSKYLLETESGFKSTWQFVWE